MKKAIIIFFCLLPIAAFSQIGYEDFYSEGDLQNVVKNAKTLAAQQDAIGSLAVYYKKHYKDSLANVYLKQVHTIGENSKEVHLIARALWWDLQVESANFRSVNSDLLNEEAKKFLKYAEQNGLVKETIEANLDLVGINVEQNLVAAEQYGITALNLLNNWKKDTLEKDSLKILIYQGMAHTYIHKSDGIKLSKYLQALQDYAIDSKNENLKMNAIEAIGSTYFEWVGQETKTIPWMEKLHEYCKRSRQPNRLLSVANYLAMIHSRLGHKEKTKNYLNEIEKLNDSLQVNSPFQYYWLGMKKDLGLITSEEEIQALDNHFNNQLFLPVEDIATTKAGIYLFDIKLLDSAEFYLSIAKKYGMDNDELWATYYSAKKDYKKLITLLQKVIKEAETDGNVSRAKASSFSISQAFQAEKQYKPAFETLLKAWHLRDSLDNLKSKDKVAEMGMQKEMDLQKASYEQQKILEKAIQERTAFKNKITLWCVATGAVLLFLVAGILWRSNRRKQKDKLEIEKAYHELKSTQAQLVHAEKMASLGELTAGIAHEIQNPLNFVNNFSDVNNELIDEVKTQKSNLKSEDLDELLNDIYTNNEKISHHGKRADAIVKSMLQHSRTSSGKKEPTDINALADEYLRLAYHGLRAKDKSFNSNFETNLDPTIGKINIVPQEVGRVILNLINNAFYTLAEKKQKLDGSFVPMVSVSTRKSNGKIEIEVKDNGNGIPKKALDKIFQPFFTTKPTGEGTGLGLSLSYDIITKGHGGDLKVETKEGEGSAFTISLPNIN